MKKVTFLIIALLVTVATIAQSVSVNVYQSINKQTGASLYKTTHTGIIYGIAGSYLFPSYTGHSNQYEELANAIIPAEGSKWGQYAKYQYGSFKENRGTVQGLLGYKLHSTSFTINFGLAFTSQYWLGKGAAILSDQNPALYFYTYENTTPVGLIGFTINQNIKERLGVVAGWNNIEQSFIGLSYKITPTGAFGW